MTSQYKSVKSLLANEEIRKKVSSFIQEEILLPEWSDTGAEVEVIEENAPKIPSIINEVVKAKDTVKQIDNEAINDSINMFGFQLSVKALLQNEEIRKQIAPFIQKQVIFVKNSDIQVATRIHKHKSTKKVVTNNGEKKTPDHLSSWIIEDEETNIQTPLCAENEVVISTIPESIANKEVTLINNQKECLNARLENPDVTTVKNNMEKQLSNENENTIRKNKQTLTSIKEVPILDLIDSSDDEAVSKIIKQLKNKMISKKRQRKSKMRLNGSHQTQIPNTKKSLEMYEYNNESDPVDEEVLIVVDKSNPKRNEGSFKDSDDWYYLNMTNGKELNIGETTLKTNNSVELNVDKTISKTNDSVELNVFNQTSEINVINLETTDVEYNSSVLKNIEPQASVSKNIEPEASVSKNIEPITSVSKEEKVKNKTPVYRKVRRIGWKGKRRKRVKRKLLGKIVKRTANNVEVRQDTKVETDLNLESTVAVLPEIIEHTKEEEAEYVKESRFPAIELIPAIKKEESPPPNYYDSVQSDSKSELQYPIKKETVTDLNDKAIMDIARIRALFDKMDWEDENNIGDNDSRPSERDGSDLSNQDQNQNKKVLPTLVVKSRDVYLEPKPKRVKFIPECYNCGKHYERIANLRRHELLCNSEEEAIVYECVMCPYKTKHKLTFKNHLGDHIMGKSSKLARTAEAPEIRKTTRVGSEFCPPAHLRAHCPSCNQEMTALDRSSRCLRCWTALGYHCGMCSEKFVSFALLRDHVLASLRRAQENCSKCGKGGFLSGCKLRKHEKICTLRQRMRMFCEKVPYVRLVRHELEDNLPKGPPYMLLAYCRKCEVSKITYEPKSNCERCDSLLSYECEPCDALSSSYTRHRAHILSVHKTDLLRCTMCDQVYGQKTPFEKFCVTEKIFNCQACKRKTLNDSTANSSDNHQLNKENSPPKALGSSLETVDQSVEIPTVDETARIVGIVHSDVKINENVKSNDKL